MRTRKRPKSKLEEDDKPLDALLDRIVSKPSMSGIITSISTRSGDGLLRQIRSAVSPSVAVSTW